MGKLRQTKKKNVAIARAAKVNAALEVKKVVLNPTAVLKVELPKGHLPIVAVDPKRRIVEIVPVPAAKKEKTWWDHWFGP